MVWVLLVFLGKYMEGSLVRFKQGLSRVIDGSFSDVPKGVISIMYLAKLSRIPLALHPLISFNHGTLSTYTCVTSFSPLCFDWHLERVFLSSLFRGQKLVKTDCLSHFVGYRSIPSYYTAHPYLFLVVGSLSYRGYFTLDTLPVELLTCLRLGTLMLYLWYAAKFWWYVFGGFFDVCSSFVRFRRFTGFR